jgi:hypothetical protein
MQENSTRRLQTESTREMRTSDPYPWVTLDENGKEFRTHTAHEDGYDKNGNLWEGWTYSPRNAEELSEDGL